MKVKTKKNGLNNLFYDDVSHTRIFLGAEFEAAIAERRMILEEARLLKEHATFHLHPELPVAGTDPTVFGRNFFNRPSAPETESVEDMEERARIMEDIKALKMYANFHLHPEKPVETTDPTATARNFFDRASAPEQETFEEGEERARIMEDVKMLKMYANFHLHPEKPVEAVDVSGRNFFTRPSAPDQETLEEMEERARILEEATSLKQYADFHLHPEKPVVTTDATACGRNFFSRPSAPEQESFEYAEERARVLEEAAMLKKYAEYHLHPEKPVRSSDPLSFGRNFFNRASAPDQESLEEAEERARVLEEAAELKKYAGFHLHPERRVESSDPISFGRNFFERPSAPEQMSLEESEERAQILEEAAMLKKYAGFHLHPERPVVSSDSTAFGRNYFTRPSAPEQITKEESDERQRILEEAALLKQYADFHLHPEKPVVTTDPATFGRNYFSRPSAPDQESLEESEERARVLEEAALLKKYAKFHLHPELPVESTDATACGRNFFSRPSAPDQESLEESEERARILEEAAQLKKYARFHLHPEDPVETTESTVFGRNFFSRPSAPEQETFEEAEERARILEEAAQLKKYAKFHLHPEARVETTDATAFGRNFFSRPSAPDQETLEEAEERARILEEARLLEKYAEFHLHPEKGVVSDDPIATGRNFFSRPSAPEQESLEDMEQRNLVLADCEELKKYAKFHLHPEERVHTSDPTASGRNFFTRPSAPAGAEITSTGRRIEESSFGKQAADEQYFFMDEDIDGMRSSIDGLRSSLLTALPDVSKPAVEETADSEEEGKLSRSPSSVMLFGLEQTQGY